MGVVLPNELVWVLGAIGVTWPNIDEDQLRHAGNEFRKLSADLSDHKAGAMGEIEQMLHLNSSESLKVFQALWEKVVKGHLSDLEEGLNILAGAMDTCAVIVEGMKVAAIAELAAFAAATAADIAAAVATGGIAAAGELALEIATKEIIKGIIQQAIDQIDFQIKQAVLAPVIDTLVSAGLNLGEQLLGNALGVNQGVDLSAVIAAGRGGLGQGASTFAGQIGGLITDPFGPSGLGVTGSGGHTGQTATDRPVPDRGRG